MKELADANERVQTNGAIVQSPEPQKREEQSTQKVGWPTLLAVPFAVAIALGLHEFATPSVSPAEALLYTYFLTGLLIAAVFAADGSNNK